MSFISLCNLSRLLLECLRSSDFVFTAPSGFNWAWEASQREAPRGLSPWVCDDAQSSDPPLLTLLAGGWADMTLF